MIAFTDLDAFTQAYIEAAFFSTTDESDETGGDYLDNNYDFNDLDSETLQAMFDDCRRFQEENAADLEAANEYITYEWGAYAQAGHDFWLTRNGHGCGFWDGDWPNDMGDRLTIAAEAHGQFYLYVGDDGKIYRY